MGITWLKSRCGRVIIVKLFVLLFIERQFNYLISFSFLTVQLLIIIVCLRKNSSGIQREFIEKLY